VADLKQQLAGLSPAERQLLAEKLSRTREFPMSSGASGIPRVSTSGGTVLDAFAGWVQRTPEAVAIADAERVLSYAELDRVAGALADALLRAGVGPESLVAFCIARSIESVVAMLATVKVGAAYVPIDRDDPQTRIELMLRDTGAQVLLVSNPADFRELAYDGKIISVIRDLEVPRGDGRQPSGIRITPQSLACVMYTSGSTGQPKGVCIEHRGISRLVCDPDYIDLGPADCIAHASNPAFDAATFEVWAALANGASLEVLATENLLSPQTMRRQIESRRLTVLFLTTALFNELAAADAALFAPLRCLLIGGEAASLCAFRQVVAEGKPARLINAYGPTENTTFTTCYEASEEMLAPDCNSVPIGRAIRGTYVRVLDEDLKAVSLGQTGDLYAGGEGLARGYFGRPELTEAAFVSDPFDPCGEGRLYRTGDRVLLRHDGNIEFLGRTDEQLKLRGFRIEPGEIQRALESNPRVRSAVVFAHGEQGTPKALVACIKPAEQASIDWELLRSELRSRLPEYMMPQRWLDIGEWPLNANGKIDRGALARRVDTEGSGGISHASPSVTPAEPRSETERQLVAIVRDLIHSHAVSVTDDFFSVGGHSLLATRLALRVARDCGVRLAVSEIFDHPVLRDLAARIDHLLNTAGNAASPATAEIVDEVSTYPLSSMQQRLWFLEQLEPGLTTYHMHMALRLRGALDSRLLEGALNLLVARHDTLRTSFALHGEEFCQEVRAAARASLPVFTLPTSAGAELDGVLQQRFDALFEPAFDLFRGPLYRTELICIAPDDHVFSLVMHHIISDGWSMNVLREELAEAYRALLNGERPRLAELPMQYGAYANACAALEATPEYERQLAYWANALRGLPVLDLPTDGPRPTRQDSTGSVCTHMIDPDFSACLRTFCKDQGVTLFMLLMAVCQLLLARLSNQTDIAVGIPIAGRSRIELERLIGFFVNTLVIRGDLSGNPAFDEHLARVRHTALEAYTNSSVPFERLVDLLRPRRDLGRNPLYDVMLNIVHETPESSFGDVRATVLKRKSVVAKVDLELYVQEQPSGIELRLVYRSALFSDARMRVFLDQFVSLLEQVLVRPQSGIEDYSLAVGNRKGVLPDPCVGIDQAPIPSVLSRFLHFAAAQPEQTAIDAGDRSLPSTPGALPLGCSHSGCAARK
jgi:amino acid adenylation domain-containing protein